MPFSGDHLTAHLTIHSLPFAFESALTFALLISVSSVIKLNFNHKVQQLRKFIPFHSSCVEKILFFSSREIHSWLAHMTILTQGRPRNEQENLPWWGQLIPMEEPDFSSWITFFGDFLISLHWHSVMNRAGGQPQYPWTSALCLSSWQPCDSPGRWDLSGCLREVSGKEAGTAFSVSSHLQQVECLEPWQPFCHREVLSARKGCKDYRD